MKTATFGVCMWLCATVCSAASPFDGKWTGTFMRPAPLANADTPFEPVHDDSLLSKDEVGRTGQLEISTPAGNST